MVPWFRRDPVLAVREEVEDLLSRIWGDEGDGWLVGRYSPSLDLAETDSTVEVRLDLPGAKPEEIDIQLSGNVLTVSGERKEEKEEKGRTFHRVERREGGFSRSISLPCAVEEEKVQAQYRDGVLSITMPKTEKAKAKKIKVKS
jgi:HSP20 family protein